MNSRSTARRNASVNRAVSCTGPRHERAVGPEPAVGDEQVEARMPVGTSAVHLQTGDDAHRKVPLAGVRADRRGDRAGGHAGDLAEPCTAGTFTRCATTTT